MLSNATWKSYAIFWAALLLAIVANPSSGFSQIMIDADANVGPTIDTWGWDIKGAVGRIGNAKKAKLYFQDTSANLLRIPIDAHARFENGEISDTPNSGVDSISNNKKMLASIRAAKLANPDIKIFAGLKLLGTNTFPDWVTEPGSKGTIFGQTAEQVDPQQYARLLTGFVQFMAKEEISIDFLGPGNETEGLLDPPRFAMAVDALRRNLSELVASGKLDNQYTQFKIVAAETFFVRDSVRYVYALTSAKRSDLFDVVGSHFYADFVSRGKDNPNGWAALKATSDGKPMWLTEVHMNSYNTDKGESPSDNIRKMRGGMGSLFEANMQGATGFVWWGGLDIDNSVSNRIRKHLVETTMNGTPVRTQPRFDMAKPKDPLAQAYLNNDKLHLWIANPSQQFENLKIKIVDFPGQKKGLTVESATFWSEGEIIGDNGDGAKTGELEAEVDTKSGEITLSTLPQDSVALLTITGSNK